MDFRTAEPILDALGQAVDRGIFGYPYLLARCREATVSWLGRRHGFTCMPEQIFFMPRVVGGTALAITCFTKPGEGIIIQPPVYGPLHSVVTDNEHKLPARTRGIQDGSGPP